MKWLAAENYHEMSRLGAERIYQVIAEASRARRRVNIGFATGNTMLELYPLLAEMLNRNQIRLDLLSTYNLDEYVADGHAVPHSHPLSYFTYMHENLFRHIDPALGLTEERIHFPDPEHPEAFDAELEAGGGLDLQLLGIGFNGHIVEHLEAFLNFSLPLKVTNFSSLKWAAISSSRKILHEITRTRTASKLSVLFAKKAYKLATCSNFTHIKELL